MRLPCATRPIHARLGNKLFGVEDCADIEAADALIDTIQQSFVPDEAQRTALRRALASELLLILGPPGTGKTDVLAAIALLHAILYQHRVLIVSHTNIAIDNAVIRLRKFFLAQGLGHLIEEHTLVRMGAPRLAELQEPAYHPIVQEEIAEAQVQAQRDEIVRLEQHRAISEHQRMRDTEELQEQRQTWEQDKIALLQEHKDLHDALEGLEAEEHERLATVLAALTPLVEQDRQARQTIQAQRAIVDAQTRLLAPLEEEDRKLGRTYDTTTARLATLYQHHPFTRFFVQLFTNEWETDLIKTQTEIREAHTLLTHTMAPYQKILSDARTHIERATQQREVIAPPIKSLIHQRETQPTSYTQEKADILADLATCDDDLQDGNPRIAELEQAIAYRIRVIASFNEVLAHLDQAVKEAKHEAMRTNIQEAQVACATLTGLYLKSSLLDEEWDVVILDEASMAPSPAIYIAANRARYHLILVGDTLQLAPVCKLHDPKVKTWYEEDPIQEWIGRDVFYHGKYTLHEAGTETHYSVLLPYQDRMHPDICDLVRTLFYKGLLKDRLPLPPHPLLGPEPDAAVVLYDTSHLAGARAERPKRGSRFNKVHADLTVTLARQMLATMPTPHKPQCIGIVTPYVAQREEIKKRIVGTDLESVVRVGTIHAFQGLEFDGVIFDTTEAPCLAIAPSLRGMWGSEAMRLLNVAVTRARHKLVIIAHREHIHTLPSSMLLPRILNLAAQKKCVLMD